MGKGGVGVLICVRANGRRAAHRFSVGHREDERQRVRAKKKAEIEEYAAKQRGHGLKGLGTGAEIGKSLEAGTETYFRFRGELDKMKKRA